MHFTALLWKHQRYEPCKGPPPHTSKADERLNSAVPRCGLCSFCLWLSHFPYDQINFLWKQAPSGQHLVARKGSRDESNYFFFLSRRCWAVTKHWIRAYTREQQMTDKDCSRLLQSICITICPPLKGAAHANRTSYSQRLSLKQTQSWSH